MLIQKYQFIPKMKKLKFVHQLDSNDCGLACLKMISSYYGKNFSHDFLSNICYRNRTGVSMLNLKDSAEILGFKAKGILVNFEKLRTIPFPFIAYWNQCHYVVVYEIKENKVFLADPAKGLLTYSKDSFLKCWMTNNDMINPRGVALLLIPTSKFYQLQEKQISNIKLTHLFKYVLPYKSYIFKVILGILLSMLMGLILPLLTQVVVDNGITSKDLRFIVIILLSQVFLSIGASVNTFIQNWLFLHISTRISVTLVSDFLNKLMKLKIAFFDSRLIGDIIQRINDFDRVENFLCSSLITTFTIICIFIVNGSLILKYSFSIMLVFLLGSILYILWILYFRKKRETIDYMRFQESSLNYSNVIQLITGIHDIKLNTCENKKRFEWEKIQISLHSINMKSLWVNQMQDMGASLIDNLKNLLISFITICYVINGDLTIGMYVSIQYIVGHLNVPLYQLIGLIQQIQDVKISLRRINDIYSKEEENAVGFSGDMYLSEKSLNFNNVTFQYGGLHSPIVLSHINISVPYGKTTAIVGASGSGKTTMLKLMLGYYPPTTGTILLGDRNLGDINIREWRNKCAIVIQEGYLFSDTIAGNIALSSEVVDLEKVKLSAKIACINTFIESLPKKYETRIGMDGVSLSSGQKQRILIARAIYKDANYIFLDEATNSLDATNESDIVSNLHNHFKGKTLVIIAHRLSTVRNADNIIVLNHGMVVEQGTHHELISRCGVYYRLVKNQLETY